MLCEKCKKNMIHVNTNSVQGWKCSNCGWNILTTNIDKIYNDTTEYSIYIKETIEINKEQIKLVSKIAQVSYVIAKHMLEKGNVCAFKSKAWDIKKIVEELEQLNIQFEIIPEFNYK